MQTRRARTDGGGGVGGVALAGALVADDDALPLALAHQHHVLLLARDGHALLVPPGLHVYHLPPAAATVAKLRDVVRVGQPRRLSDSLTYSTSRIINQRQEASPVVSAFFSLLAFINVLYQHSWS